MPEGVAPHSCGGCQCRWWGLTVAHCGSCHLTFGGVALFDEHRVRVGTPRCRRLAELAKVGIIPDSNEILGRPKTRG